MGSFTYKHDTLNQKSWLDHFFISRDFSKYLNNVEIIDRGDNLSDHLIISCELFMPLKKPILGHQQGFHKGPRRAYKDRWDHADLLTYFNLSGIRLNNVYVPSHLFHCGMGCECHDHRIIIENYYNDIVQSLILSSH